MAKFRGTYEYTRQWSHPRHTWSVVTARAGAHLHITDNGEGGNFIRECYSGGIEIHYRTPPEYMTEDAPSSDECWLLKCPCWHDGSSLQATEFWIPRWQADPHDHDAMLERLFRELMTRLETTD